MRTTVRGKVKYPLKKNSCCAVCGDKVRTNLIFRWKRDKDQRVFVVCALCAEAGKANETSVDNYANGVIA